MSLRLERLLAIDVAIRGGRYPSVPVHMRRFEVRERMVCYYVDYFKSTPLPRRHRDGICHGVCL